MTKKTRKEIAEAHNALTRSIAPGEVERIVDFERLLCTIFGKQWALGSEKCYALRKAIVDFHSGNPLEKYRK